MSFSPVALASAVIVTKYVIFVNFDTCFKNTVALYVVIKIIDKIVKIITLLCCICNNCFVNIVGIENLTNCVDPKINLCLQTREIANFGKI